MKKTLISAILVIALVLTFPSALSRAGAASFSDSSGHWAESEIDKWASYGVLRGDGGRFRPDDTITRAELAAVVSRVSGYTAMSPDSFSDVLPGSWYYTDVMAALGAGVISADGGLFRPNEPALREVAVTTFARALGLKDSGIEMPFYDVGDISADAKGLVSAMWSAGYVNGSGGYFYPASPITRAGIVKLLDNIMGAFYKPPGRVIDPSKPMVALTFDDGPSKTTTKILDILEQYDARATFCVVGYLLDDYADTLRRAVSQGSEIASHTWSHKSLTSLSDGDIKKDLTRVNDAVREITGVTPVFVRPPYGSYNTRVKTVAGSMDMSLAYWSIDPRDWETRNAQSTYNAVMRDVKDGSIILCHDSQPSTGTAMEKIIPELIARGYQLVTLSELIKYSTGSIDAGKIYFSSRKYS